MEEYLGNQRNYYPEGMQTMKKRNRVKNESFTPFLREEDGDEKREEKI